MRRLQETGDLVCAEDVWQDVWEDWGSCVCRSFNTQFLEITPPQIKFLLLKNVWKTRKISKHVFTLPPNETVITNDPSWIDLNRSDVTV